MRAAVLLAVVLTGCEVLGPLVGAGAGTALKKDQESEVAESFTHSLQRTRTALLAALKRMGIEVTSAEAERITGKTKDQPVEVELKAVTEKTTRIKVTIGEGVKKDRATAEEVIQQTQRILSGRAVSS